MRLRTTCFSALVVMLSGCGQRPAPAQTETPPPMHSHHHGHHHDFADAGAWAKVFDDPSRDAWQRPDDVLRAMELSPSMTVADVGAGTGYFSVRLARAVPSGKVIATDVEPGMVQYLNERAQREKLANLQAIQGTATASGLTAGSVDRILVVDVWHHLGDRVAYARDLAAALRRDGKLFIVDFTLASTQGPPPSMRLAPETIVSDLTKAGFKARVAPVTLPDQYVVEATLLRE